MSVVVTGIKPQRPLIVKDGLSKTAELVIAVGKVVIECAADFSLGFDLKILVPGSLKVLLLIKQVAFVEEAF